MTVFGALGAMLGRGGGRRDRLSLASRAKTAARALRVLAGFDAAKTTDSNRRHWAHADLLGPNASLRPAVRRTIRSRARYEVENNSYAKGIVSTLANDVIGTGPRVQVTTDNVEANRTIEREFAAWAKNIGLASKLRTMRTAKAVDGEAFALLATNDSLQHPVTLDLRLLEADQVARASGTADPRDLTDGIEFDSAGNPKSYRVLREHPGERNMASGFTATEEIIRASRVIHWFRVDRPGQRRGVSEIAPALPLFAQLRRWTLAVLDAAENSARLSTVLQTEAPPGGEAEAVEPLDVIELERAMMTVLPAGWSLGQLKAEHPSTTTEQFRRAILNEIARSLNMPFNVAAGNSSGYNYASGRLDHQTYFKAIRVEQNECGFVVLDRIFRAWLDEAVLISDFLPTGARSIAAQLEGVPHEWMFDGMEHVDPIREANAQAVRLKSGTTTLAQEYARQGKDWETELRQAAREQALARELGVTLGHAPADVDPDDEPAGEEAADAAE